MPEDNTPSRKATRRNWKSSHQEYFFPDAHSGLEGDLTIEYTTFFYPRPRKEPDVNEQIVLRIKYSDRTSFRVGIPGKGTEERIYRNGNRIGIDAADECTGSEFDREVSDIMGRRPRSFVLDSYRTHFSEETRRLILKTLSRKARALFEKGMKYFNISHMPEELTPKELVDDLNYIRDIKDGRLWTLFLHLYIEHFINKIAEEKRIKQPSAVKKAKVLLEQSIINHSCFDSIDLINDIRNKLIHNLRPDVKMLERWIENFKPDIKDADPKLIAAYNDSEPWVKLQIFCVPVIVYLYKILKAIRKEDVDYDMNIGLQYKEDKNHIWTFSLLKKTPDKNPPTQL